MEVSIETLIKTNYFHKKEKYHSIEVSSDDGFDYFLIDKKDIPKDGLETLLYVIENGADFSYVIEDIIASIAKEKYSVIINGTLFEWEEIKHLFNSWNFIFLHLSVKSDIMQMY